MFQYQTLVLSTVLSYQLILNGCEEIGYPAVKSFSAVVFSLMLKEKARKAPCVNVNVLSIFFIFWRDMKSKRGV